MGAEHSEVRFMDRRSLFESKGTPFISLDQNTLADEFGLDRDVISEEDIDVVERIHADGRIVIQLPEKYVSNE